jgi:pilus assembly protein Flp/PilA
MLFAPKEKGQGLVEYALILVLVAVVVIAVLTLLGPIIGNVFSKVNTNLQ